MEVISVTTVVQKNVGGTCMCWSGGAGEDSLH